VVLAVFCCPFLSVLAKADLYGPDDRRHVVHPLALAPRAATDQALVNFNWMLATNAVAFWPDHPGPELVENLEGGFIAREPELALELKRGLAGRLGGH
jgi:hypothetical protein